jgi:PEP-CTERM motif
MNLAKLAAGAAIAVCLGLSTGAQATSLLGQYTVSALTPFGSWQDTGLDLSASQKYQFDVINPDTLWSAGSNTPFSRESTANGINPAYYGTWTMDGFTARFGALVGDAGGTLFLIGTGPTVISGLSGDLTVGYWDSYYPDNSGTQTLDVSTVPEPVTWALMLIGAGMLGVGLRMGRRDHAAASAAA